jgi:excisionase family DNA binding protein
MSNDIERLAMSIPEAAKALGISRNHAYMLAAKGEIPTIKLGNRFVVPIEALRKLCLLHEVTCKTQEMA